MHLLQKKSNTPGDQLERQYIGGDNFHCLDLKVLMSCCPEQSNPPLLWTRCFQRNHVIPLNVLGVSGISELGLGYDRASHPCLAQPLGRRCQSCSPRAPNVPGSNGEGPATPLQRGRDKADIVVCSLITKLIINQKDQRPN